MPQAERGTLRKCYDVGMLLLCLYVVAVVALEVVADFSERTVATLERIDFVICLVFLADWFYFLAKAEKKGQYAKSRSLDLLASIPFVQILRPFRILRIVRLARALRLLRGLKGVFPLLRYVSSNVALSALTIYMLCTVIIYFYCALGIYNFEKGVNAGIGSFGDSLWLSFTTLTSVGYGDMYPITTGGRIMAAILVIVGMGMFSLLTAEFATLFLSRLRGDEQEGGEAQNR